MPTATLTDNVLTITDTRGRKMKLVATATTDDAVVAEAAEWYADNGATLFTGTARGEKWVAVINPGADFVSLLHWTRGDFDEYEADLD